MPIIDPMLLGVLSLVALLVMLALGIHIAIALFVISITGVCLVMEPKVAFGMLGELPFRTMNSWLLACVPLFIIMGSFAGHAGFTKDVFRTARLWLSRLPGGLCMAATAGCAAFGAATGSTLAASAVMGSTIVPELRRYKYDVSLATGTVASAAGLAGLIPPSIALIIFGFLAEESVPKLFIAGFIPGMVTVLVFWGMIIARVKRNPSLAPPVPGRVSWRERLVSLKGVWGILVLAIMVMGGLYTGVFTPTEAGGAGALGAFLVALILRRLTRQNLHESLLEAAMTTAKVFFIVIAAMFYCRFLVVTGLTGAITTFLIEFSGSHYILILLMLVIYIFMGMFLEPIGMMTITVPIFLPAVVAMGIDPIWYGIFVVKVCEIGLITPPVGMNCFVLHSVIPDVGLPTIFRGCIWFVAMDVVVIAILTAWPQIVLFLPGTMYR